MIRIADQPSPESKQTQQRGHWATDSCQMPLELQLLSRSRQVPPSPPQLAGPALLLLFPFPLPQALIPWPRLRRLWPMPSVRDCLPILHSPALLWIWSALTGSELLQDPATRLTLSALAGIWRL